MPSISPVDFLENLIKETTAPEMDIKQIIQPSHSITNFFLNPTEKDLKSYSSPVIQATRAGDIPALRTLADSGVSLQCCNKFGESLIHLTCRRGLDHVAEFLLREAKVMARVKDDYGRTPMHDACWTTKPNFRLMRLLIQEEPRLLFLSDRRSHTPLNYIRREHWSVWVSFLESIKDDLIATIAMIHIENINKI
jgi:ankyrin repeat protein